MGLNFRSLEDKVGGRSRTGVWKDGSMTAVAALAGVAALGGVTALEATTALEGVDSFCFRRNSS